MLRVIASVMLLGLLIGSASPTTVHAQTPAVAPVTIRIPGILVDTTIETVQTDPDPSGTWTVLWYEGYESFGTGGNTVLYGYRDFFGIGPSVFYFFDQLGDGDEVEIVGSDGNVYSYVVNTVETIAAATASVETIFTTTAEEMLTLFSYGGDFDVSTQSYESIFVAYATPVETTDTLAMDQPLAGQSADCPVAPRDIMFPNGANLDPSTSDRSEAALNALDVPNATVTDASDIASIDALLIESSGCDMVVREAMTLSDGRVLALVGPAGQLPITMITASGGLLSLRFETAAKVCDFALFTRVNGSWTVEAVPWF